jgi:hypothetical protein
MKASLTLIVLLISIHTQAQNWGIKWLKTDLNVDATSEFQDTLVSLSLRRHSNLMFHLQDPCLEITRDLKVNVAGSKLNVTNFQALGNRRAFFETYAESDCMPDSLDCFPIFEWIQGVVEYGSDTVIVDTALVNLNILENAITTLKLVNDSTVVKVKEIWERDTASFYLKFYNIKHAESDPIEISYRTVFGQNQCYFRNFGLVADSLIRVTIDCYINPDIPPNRTYLVFHEDTLFLDSTNVHIFLNKRGKLVHSVKLPAFSSSVYFDVDGNAYYMESHRLKKLSVTGNPFWTSADSISHGNYFVVAEGRNANLQKNVLILLRDNSFILLDSIGNTLWKSLPSSQNIKYTFSPVAHGDWLINGVYNSSTPLHFNGIPLPAPGINGKGTFVVRIGAISDLSTVVPQNGYCAGDSIMLTVSGTIQVEPDNVFEIEMSDQFGSFANPVVVSSGATTVQTFVLPQALAEGDKYKFRTKSTHPPQVGLPSEGCLTVSLPVEAPVITPADSQFLCLPMDKVILRVSSSAPFVWNYGMVADSLIISGSGNFYAVAQNRGCKAISNEVFVSARFPPRLPSMPTDTTFCRGTSSVFVLPNRQPGAFWTGYGVVNDSLYVNNIDSSSVQLTYNLNNRNCMVTANLRVFLQQPGEGNCVLVDNSKLLKHGFSVFPNPSQGTFILVAQEGVNAENMVLRDIQGREVRVQWQSTGKGLWQLSGLKTGIYFLKVAGNKPVKLLVVE